MDHRSEARVMVARDLVDLACGLRLCIHVGVGAPDEPEYGRHMPLRTERAEVLARGSGSRLEYARSGEMVTERVDDASTRVGIVCDERLLIERRDFRRLGRAR